MNLLFLALAALSVGNAAPRWGTFRDLGCIDPVRRPGLRAESAVLWGASGDVGACTVQPATFPTAFLTHPAVCIGAGYQDTVLVDSSAFAASAGCSDAACAAPGYRGAARLVWDVSGEVVASGGALAQALDATPAQVYAGSAAHVAVWGLFLVPDPACVLDATGQG